MKKTVAIANAIAVLLLGGACVALGVLYNRQLSRNAELEVQLQQLARQEQQSVVRQHINAQMEEIANEERRISDEQRDLAIEQTRVAEQERLNAEQQRRQAETERQNALAAEQKAVEASKTAQQQRAVAEQQRTAAEYSKRVTDTLSYLTLARSLAGNAVTQHMAGNREIADLLAYTATLFTYRYRGDIYSGMTYQALALTSQNKNVWNKHKGSVTDISFLDDSGNDLLTCSTYGEVFHHHLKGTNLQTKTLVHDARYDFRHLYIERNRNVCYALSRTGHLLVIRNDRVEQIVETGINNLLGMKQAEGRHYLFGEHDIALFDTNTAAVTRRKKLPAKLVCFSSTGNVPLLFDNRGNQYVVKDFDNIETSRVPFSGQVTAYAESDNGHTKVYGMKDGTLHYVNSDGKATRLTGHRSLISNVKIDGHRIFTSSYDGTTNLWLTGAAKTEPMTLFSCSGWVISFTSDPREDNIWAGDQKGNLTETLIDLPTMIERIRSRLSRNFTRDEWNYYVGSNVPYEEILGKEVRP